MSFYMLLGVYVHDDSSSYIIPLAIMYATTSKQ